MAINWPELKLPPLNLWNYPEWRYNVIYDHTLLQDAYRNGSKVEFYNINENRWEEIEYPGWHVHVKYRMAENKKINSDEIKRAMEINKKLMNEEEWDALPKHAKTSPLTDQVGGNHYKDMPIQPVEFIAANNIGFIEGSIIKYVCRHKTKNGKQDLEKAKHFIDLLITLSYDNAQ